MYSNSFLFKNKENNVKIKKKEDFKFKYVGKVKCLSYRLLQHFYVFIFKKILIQKQKNHAGYKKPL